MEFKHISEVEEAINNCKTKEELEELLEDIPNGYGDWEIQCNDDGYCVAVNDWYDKVCETWEHDEYETELRYRENDEDCIYDYDTRAVEKDYNLQEGYLDDIDIRSAEKIVGEEEGALDRYLWDEYAECYLYQEDEEE